MWLTTTIGIWAHILWNTLLVLSVYTVQLNSQSMWLGKQIYKSYWLFDTVFIFKFLLFWQIAESHQYSLADHLNVRSVLKRFGCESGVKIIIFRRFRFSRPTSRLTDIDWYSLGFMEVLVSLPCVSEQKYPRGNCAFDSNRSQGAWKDPSRGNTALVKTRNISSDITNCVQFYQIRNLFTRTERTYWSCLESIRVTLTVPLATACLLN